MSWLPNCNYCCRMYVHVLAPSFYSPECLSLLIFCFFFNITLFIPLIPQIANVLRVMGSVTSENWPEASSLPDFEKICFPNFSPKPFSTVFPNGSPYFVTLLERMLILDPKRRITADRALQQAVSLF